MSNFSASIDRNPLIEGLPCDITEIEWWNRLRFDPFAGNDLQELSPFRKQLFAHFSDRGHPFHADRGHRFTPMADSAQGMRVTGFIVSQVSAMA
ncbi:hypothetical protein, partial [Rubrivivax albus]